MTTFFDLWSFARQKSRTPQTAVAVVGKMLSMLSKLSFFHLHAALDDVCTKEGGEDCNYNLKNSLNL